MFRRLLLIILEFIGFLMLWQQLALYSSGTWYPSVEYGVLGKVFEISFRSVLYVACKSKFNKACALFVFDGVVRSSAACEIKANALETSDSVHHRKHQICSP
jgi:hypothetical protein